MREDRREQAAAPVMVLWSLRPAGEHAALRREAQAAGLRLRALSVQRVVPRADPQRLAAALAAPIRLYTSPAAVRFAALGAGDLRRAGLDLGVGRGTVEALRRAGVDGARAPQRMDSEGVLAMPELETAGGRPIGLVTAPGGRGVLAEALAGRGFALRVAEVYERRALRGGARRFAAFVTDPAAVLLVSSGEALHRLLAALPEAHSARGRALRDRRVVVSSARLAALAASAGFSRVSVADGPGASALLTAAVRPGR